MSLDGLIYLPQPAALTEIPNTACVNNSSGYSVGPRRWMMILGGGYSSCIPHGGVVGSALGELRAGGGYGNENGMSGTSVG